MNNGLDRESTGKRDELRELHMLYWTISQSGEATFPPRSYEEFVVFCRGLSSKDLADFRSQLRERYHQIVEESVPEGMKVIEKYLRPGPRNSH